MSARRLNSLHDSGPEKPPELRQVAQRREAPIPRPVRRLTGLETHERDEEFLQPILATSEVLDDIVMFLRPKLRAKD